MRLNIGRRASAPAPYEPLKSPYIRQHSGASQNTVDVTFATMCLLVLGLIGISSLSFIAGQHLKSASPGDVLDLKSAGQVFKYNRIFADRPNITSDKAWLDLFPTQGGFFKHPELAPQRSTFAVFHQLHCLDGIRHGYWTLFDLALAGKKINEKDIPFQASASHIGHCIDLLRHALMCQPDLTIEVQDDAKGGVTGFGTEHQCVDWQGLVDWTGEWEGFEQEQGTMGGGQKGPKVEHGRR